MKPTDTISRVGEIRGCGSAILELVKQLLASDTADTQLHLLKRVVDLGQHIVSASNDLFTAIKVEDNLNNTP